MDTEGNNDSFVKKVDELCGILDVASVRADGNIDAKNAIYHTITEIKAAVCVVLKKERVGIIGRHLKQNLGLGRHILEEDGDLRGVESVYAMTKEWLRKLLLMLEDREKWPKKIPWKRDIGFPTPRWNGVRSSMKGIANSR